MWKYKQTASATPYPTAIIRQPRERHGDDSRRHALNWMAAVTSSGYIAILALWWMLTTWNLPAAWLAGFYPIPFAAGIVVGSYKLVQFTTKYRAQQFTHTLNSPATTPDPQRKPGDPIIGTLLRGVDGAMHRIDTELTEEEIQAVKRHILSGKKYVVRGLLPILGDRATALRPDLQELAILHPTKGTAPAKLTAGGLIAVRRW